jgi:hypothetical protein
MPAKLARVGVQEYEEFWIHIRWNDDYGRIE